MDNDPAQGQYVKEHTEKVVIVLQGRHAGKKAVIIKNIDDGNKQRPYGHAIIAGIARYPMKVTKSMSAEKVAKRSRVKPFIQVINYNHFMPTRYGIELEDLKDAIDAKKIRDPSQRRAAVQRVRKSLNARHLAGRCPGVSVRHFGSRISPNVYVQCLPEYQNSRALWKTNGTRRTVLPQSTCLTRKFHTVSAIRHGHATIPPEGEGLTVTFVTPAGQKKTVRCNNGDSLLEIAHANNIDLEGACEASLACSTCHVILDEDVYDRLEEPSDEENDMLDLAFGLTETSRLGCQVRMSKDLDGMTVYLPAATRNMAVDGFKPKPH
ncbi:mitochondrial matrix iron-sulfur protein [Dispira simplex]|nr:mitochondrial matrix iron-sulfur protein [Dispira simplex]